MRPAAGKACGFPAWSAGQLGVHLVFAVSTLLLWPITIVQALRRFPRPPGPSAYSPTHRAWARLAAASMFMTAVTGWVFYYLAFVG